MAGISEAQLEKSIAEAIAKVRAEYEVQLAADALTIQRLRAEKENYVVSEVHKDIWRGTYTGRPATLNLADVADPRGPAPALTKEQELEAIIAFSQADPNSGK